jgi:mannose-6-phosphate isomerase
LIASLFFQIAIALTPFLALCDFRPHDEIYQLLKSHSELVELLGTGNIELIDSNGAEGLKMCYSKLMKSDGASIRKCIDSLSEKFSNDNSKLAEVFRQIQKDFPYDVGSLSLFFLNLIEMKAGQSIYLAAKIPHAYLYGDCVSVPYSSSSSSSLFDQQLPLSLISVDRMHELQ